MKRSVIRIFAGSRNPDFASRHPGYAAASHRQRVVTIYEPKAKQSRAARSVLAALDCFAALAMTVCAIMQGDPVLAGRAKIARSAAGLLQQADAVEAHGFVRRLEHVVDREAGDRNRRQRLHLDACLPGYLHLDLDAQ
jgi:hypothetical protein